MVVGALGSSTIVFRPLDICWFFFFKLCRGAYNTPVWAIIYTPHHPPKNKVEEQKNRHNICHPHKIRDAEIQLCFGGEGEGVAYIMAYTCM